VVVRPLNFTVRRLAVRTFDVINTIAAAVNAVVWFGLAWVGWGLLRGVETRHVAGYPNRGQLIYYLGFPMIMAASALALFAVARYTRFRAPALLTQVLVFFVLLPFLLGYGGGV
jgi:hypothetical protein